MSECSCKDTSVKSAMRRSKLLLDHTFLMPFLVGVCFATRPLATPGFRQLGRDNDLGVARDLLAKGSFFGVFGLRGVDEADFVRAVAVISPR